MRYLFAYLLRHSFFLLFLFLEVLAFIMIFNHNKYHTSVILNSTNDFTSAVTETFQGITDYFSLRRQNEELAIENAKLRNNLNSAIIRTDTSFYYQDTIYRYTCAKVVTNSINRRNNYLILNKGHRHGVSKDMGVISGDGIVGIVVGVSKSYCIVMSMLHKDSKTSALVLKNNQLGNISWNTSDYRMGALEDIPAHIILNRGDTVVTSGYSFIFPRGIPVGVVEEYFNDRTNNLNSASIRYFTDFGTLKNVYIIRNLVRQEFDILNENQINE